MWAKAASSGMELPVVSLVTRTMRFDHVSRAQMFTLPSGAPPAIRFVARLAKKTQRPSAGINGLPDSGIVDEEFGSLGALPFASALTRRVMPAFTLRTNTSLAPFVSPLTRLLARLAKATNWPLEE